ERVAVDHHDVDRGGFLDQIEAAIDPLVEERMGTHLDANERRFEVQVPGSRFPVLAHGSDSEFYGHRAPVRGHRRLASHRRTRARSARRPGSGPYGGRAWTISSRPPWPAIRWFHRWRRASGSGAAATDRP